jgi:hypothetical protein
VKKRDEVAPDRNLAVSIGRGQRRLEPGRPDAEIFGY